MPDSPISTVPASPRWWLDAYDRARLGDNSILHVIAAGLGWLAQVELKEFGNWGPFVAVFAWFAGDYVNRAIKLGSIGLDAMNRGAVNRNLVFSAMALGVCYAPWVYQKVELTPAWANFGLYLLDAVKRLLDENRPKDDNGKPLPNPDPIRPSLPTVAMVLVAMLSLSSAAVAGPRTVRVGANIQGQWTYIRLVCPTGDILDYLVEFGDDVGPTPIPPGPQPNPQPVPVPPEPMPVPPGPGPAPLPPGPAPAPAEPTFPPGEYQIAESTYKLVRSVTSANRKSETTALADALTSLRLDCESGKFSPGLLPIGLQVAYAFRDKLKTSLGAGYVTWNAEIGAKLQAVLTTHYNAGKLDSAAQWAVLLGEVVPALREAAKR